MEAERVSGIAVPNIRSKHVWSQSSEETKRTNTLHSQVLHPWTTNFPKENGFNQFPNTIMMLVLQPVFNLDRPRDIIFISWGFLARIVLQGKGVSLKPNHRLVHQASVFIFPGDRVVQLYPRTLGDHFSRLLRHAWTTLGLFLFPATTREFPAHTGSKY